MLIAYLVSGRWPTSNVIRIRCDTVNVLRNTVRGIYHTRCRANILGPVWIREMPNRSLKINCHYKNMTIKSKWRLWRVGCSGSRVISNGGGGLVVTVWRNGAKWGNMEEIFYSE